MKDASKIESIIETYKNSRVVNSDITQELIETLDLVGLPELKFALNSSMKRERDATLDFLKELIPFLISDDPSLHRKAVKKIESLYYPIESPDEEA